ncbi:MAG TPA: histidinol phosphate phosphatase domain-containing protein [Actinobacteria bacterium]|nr:histidinol phosphate phosphatase domain-containing protein [Actinomycetota bacterium]
MIFDFHNHTFLSDGESIPIEHIRNASKNGYSIIGLTDHVSYSNIDYIIDALKKDCRLAEEYWDIKAIPGVELTNVPVKSIDEMAKYAKEKGAGLVIVHGESIVEQVEPGTDYYAVNSDYVDILAHPGLITPEEADIAAAKGVFLEITGKAGHSLTNGHVVKTGREQGAKFLINSDSHSYEGLYFGDGQIKVARGAGLDENEIKEIFDKNVKLLLERIGM